MPNYLADKPKACLDPGHGGYDPGACGNGIQEKDETLDIALRLRPLLIFNGIEVVMTRDGDYAPGHLEHDLNGELQKRVYIAEAFGADLFVSIHINAGGGTGEEVLVQHFGGDAKRCADIMTPLLTQVGGWACRGVKEQNVMVLRETSMPAILTESGFIDSVADTAKLKDPNFRQAIAIAHAKGICSYFGITYKEKGSEDVLDAAVLLFTKEDYWSGTDVAAKNGNCAMFIRPADHSVPKDTMSAKKLIVIGGATVGHPGEVLLSGKTKYDTAAAVAKYLG